jgi:hypothetical protein
MMTVSGPVNSKIHYSVMITVNHLSFPDTTSCSPTSTYGTVSRVKRDPGNGGPLDGTLKKNYY